MAVLRLARPLPLPTGRLTILDIRAFASEADLAVTLLQSIQHDSTRIVITPTPTVNQHGILHVDLDISPRIADVDGVETYRRIWDAIVARAAPQLTAVLATAIEVWLRAGHRPE